MSAGNPSAEPAQEIVPAPPISASSWWARFFFRREGSRYLRMLGMMFIGGCFLFAWLFWGSWQDPKPEAPPWIPDAIVSLGGGNHERNRESLRAHQTFPLVPILVTGDSGAIFGFLEGKGIHKSLLHHEDHATSTIENAQFTKCFLDELKARRVLIVTDAYHARRALGAFRHEQPEREFAVAFEPTPQEPPKTYKSSQRRERFAAIWYLLRYGVRSW